MSTIGQFIEYSSEPRRLVDSAAWWCFQHGLFSEFDHFFDCTHCLRFVPSDLRSNPEWLIHCQSLVCAASLQNQYQANVKPLVTSKALIPKWKNNNEIKIVILGDNLQALIPWSQTLCPTSFPKFVRLPPTGSIKACLGRWNRSEITQYTNAKKQWEIWPKIKVSSSLYDNEL